MEVFIMQFVNYPTLTDMKAYDIKDAMSMAEEIAMQENIVNKLKGRPLVKVVSVKTQV